MEKNPVWETIILGDDDTGNENKDVRDKTKKKPIIDVVFDMLDEAGKIRYNPSGLHTPDMLEEDESNRKTIAILVELLSRTKFSENRRKAVIKKLRQMCGTCAYPDADYPALIDKLVEEGKNNG